MNSMKRGDTGEIWISAVLYIAIGVTIISILLSAAIPMITKMKDRNTFVQTKKILLTMDDTIRTVAREGPGSQREIASLILKAGQLTIDDTNDVISWSMETSAVLLEPNVPIKEGLITMYLASTPVSDRYKAQLNITYRNTIDLSLVSDYHNPFFGSYAATIRHTGAFTPGPITDIPIIELRLR